MFGRKHKSRSTNIVFVIFRLGLIMFALLLGGVYSAYKHFSGLDPLKLDPKAVVLSLLEGKAPKEVLGVLASFKVTQGKQEKISQQVIPEGEGTQSQSKPLFSFMLVADSHNDSDNLRKAILQAKNTYPDIQFIIGLGDYTQVGTVTELNAAKKEFDSLGLRYFLIPGDHDLWDSRDKGQDPGSNFREVFGPTFQSFIFSNFRFILLHNSDNYKGLSSEQLVWLDEELEKGQAEGQGLLVFLHEPLFHPSSEHIMGRVEKELKVQSRSLIFTLSAAKVKEVFAGDIHYFSQYEEPETNLSMNTIGSTSIERNPQAPRFAVVWVFEDGSVGVEDIQIK